VNAGADAVKAVTPATLAEAAFRTEYAHYQHQETSGTNGGAFTQGAWQDRGINTTVTQSGTDISRAASVITLATNTYRVRAYGVGYKVDDHQIRLRNTSDGTTEILGATVFTKDGSTSVLEGYLVVAGGSKTYQLQGYCGDTQNADGMGKALSTGENEVYSSVTFEVM